MQSSLAKHQLVNPATAQELHDIKRNLWVTKQGLYLSTEQIRQLSILWQVDIQTIGNFVYGEQKN
jgi:hypothetical protein